VDDVVFLFANYTNTTVDIAAVTRDGQTQILRQVPTTGAGPRPARVSLPGFTGSRTAATIGTDLSSWAILVSFSVCALEAGGAFATGGPAGVALAWPTIAASCGSTAIAVLIKLEQIQEELAAALERADNVKA